MKLVRSLSLAVLLAGSLLHAAETSNEKLPAAKDLVAKYVKMVGGEKVLAGHKSQMAKGKFSMPAQGVVGDVEMFAARPNKLLVRITIPGLGETLSGYDGKVGFSSNPATGPMLVEGKALDQLIEQADYDAALHDASKYKSMETVERTKFEGQDAYKVKLVKQNGDESFEYFDVKSGFIVGQEGIQATPLGPIKVVGAVSDYKRFGDILMASKLTQQMAGLQQVTTLTTVEFDKVDPSVFELPADVKALTKPK
jgi:hypothetical protein